MSLDRERSLYGQGIGMIWGLGFSVLIFLAADIYCFADGMPDVGFIVLAFLLFLIGALIFVIVHTKRRRKALGNAIIRPNKLIKQKVVGISQSVSKILDEYEYFDVEAGKVYLHYKIIQDKKHPGYIRISDKSFSVSRRMGDDKSLNFSVLEDGNILYGVEDKSRQPLELCMVYSKANNSIVFLNKTYTITAEDDKEYQEYYENEMKKISEGQQEFIRPKGKILLVLKSNDTTPLFEFPVEDSKILEIFVEFVHFHRFASFEDKIISATAGEPVIRDYVISLFKDISNQTIDD